MLVRIDGKERHGVLRTAGRPRVRDDDPVIVNRPCFSDD